MLNTLSDNPGARKKRTRLGRGIGSGKGKTCGRGMKGQKSRAGVAIKGFEGGQMPIYRRLPKRGFSPLNKQVYAVVNIGAIQAAMDGGKIAKDAVLDAAALAAAGLIRHPKLPVKLLAKGKLKEKCTLTVSRASESARKAVENAGGSVTLLEQNSAS